MNFCPECASQRLKKKSTDIVYMENSTEISLEMYYCMDCEEYHYIKKI